MESMDKLREYLGKWAHKVLLWIGYKAGSGKKKFFEMSPSFPPWTIRQVAELSPR